MSKLTPGCIVVVLDDPHLPYHERCNPSQGKWALVQRIKCSSTGPGSPAALSEYWACKSLPSRVKYNTEIRCDFWVHPSNIILSSIVSVKPGESYDASFGYGA